MKRFIYVLFALFAGLVFMVSNVQAKTTQEKNLTSHISKMEKVKKEKADKTVNAAQKITKHETKTAIKKININMANAKTLQSLPGIGPKIAKRIVEYRKKHAFKSTKDLLQIKGIGKKILQQLLPLVSIR